MDCSLPGSSVHGIFQARVLEWVAIAFSKVFHYLPPNCLCMRAQSLQSCPTVCNPMGDSTPGSSAPGILQARILEWVAMPSSRDLPHPGTVNYLHDDDQGPHMSVTEKIAYDQTFTLNHVNRSHNMHSCHVSQFTKYFYRLYFLPGLQPCEISRARPISPAYQQGRGKV